MSTNFKDFIARNSVMPSIAMPLVHTTAAYFVDEIRQSDALTPQKCDVFGTPLTYFFVGRPAYKVRESDGEAEVWELPCCFIFEYDVVPSPKRVFPFDSGAFAKGRMPSYVKMMEMEDFEVSATPQAPLKIVGAYFPDTAGYLHGKPHELSSFQRAFTLGPFDAQISAVHRLALEKHSKDVDDRRLSVEVQTDQIIDLKVNKPIAVVAPAPYFDDIEFSDHVTKVWGARPIAYSISSLSSVNYYGAIYERVFDFYKELGLL